VTTNRFSQPAADAVSYHGVAVFLRYGETCTGFFADFGGFRFFFGPLADFEKKQWTTSLFTIPQSQKLRSLAKAEYLFRLVHFFIHRAAAREKIKRKAAYGRANGER
jgi:hypothetical protein